MIYKSFAKKFSGSGIENYENFSNLLLVNSRKEKYAHLLKTWGIDFADMQLVNR